MYGNPESACWPGIGNRWTVNRDGQASGARRHVRVAIDIFPRPQHVAGLFPARGMAVPCLEQCSLMYITAPCCRVLFLASLGLMLTFSLPASAAGPLPAASRISSVTVYRGSAIVTREASVELPVGLQEILFSNLPDELDPDLLQVTGSGSAQATILEVIATPAQLAAPANPRLRELQEQIRTAQTELQTVVDQIAVVQQQRDYLERIKTLSTTMPNGDIAPSTDPAQWDKMIAFYTERQGRLVTELRNHGRQREDLQQRLEALQRQMNDLAAPAEHTVQNVLVRCDVAQAGKLTLQLAYTVQDADWQPAYDVRVSSADKSITLGYAGIVRQSTGEDWPDVELVLSTAEPSLGGTPPSFDTWFVRERPPITVVTRQFLKDAGAANNESLLQYTSNSEPAGIHGNFAGAAELEKIQVLDSASAEVDTGLTSATFTIPFRAGIPADNAPHRVAIGRTSLPGRINHVSLPKLGERAYLRALVTNDAEFPLVAGEVNLFLDGHLVSHAGMRTVMPGATFLLNLGVDDGIAVKRRLVNRLVENTGAFAKRNRITYDVVITIENNHPTAETIVVKDQVPVSQHEKIVVSLLEPAKPAIVTQVEDAATDGAVRRADDGTISWTVKLAPGEKRELPLKFSLEHPADFPVDGIY